MSELNDAVEIIIMHKAEKMKRSKKYNNYIKNVLTDHHIGVTKETMDMFVMGGVDAMIYDVGQTLGFVRNTTIVDDWTSRIKRREMLKKIFPERKGTKRIS